MTPLPEGMTRDDAIGLIYHGGVALRGHQVVSFDDAWNACTDLDPKDMGPKEARSLRWCLKRLGYEKLWVAEFGRNSMEHLWVRGPWPCDFEANMDRPFTSYILAC